MLGRSPYMQVYDHQFVGKVRTDIPMQYAPKKSDVYKPVVSQPPTEGILGSYGKLRDIFPEATYTAYIWPLSPWHIARLNHVGRLPTILDISSQLVPIFHKTYDFSVPSDITANKDNSYDGSHYYSHVFDLMAEQLESRGPGFGLEIKAKHSYLSAYQMAMENFLTEQQL